MKPDELKLMEAMGVEMGKLRKDIDAIQNTGMAIVKKCKLEVQITPKPPIPPLEVESRIKNFSIELDNLLSKYEVSKIKLEI